jgi:hypothetical protein
MLYADENLFKGVSQYISEAVKEFESRNNVVVIYGATIGSISRGIHDAASDYDVRFLYISKEDWPLDKKFFSAEDKIRHRLINKDSKCNCIALWEASAFLNFIIHPCINRGLDYNLSRIVIWTVSSPYSYDPYGLKSFLQEFVNLAVDIKKEFEFHRERAEFFINKIQETFDKRSALNFIHHGLSVKWLALYGQVAPISIWSLIRLLEKQDKKTIAKFILNRKAVADESEHLNDQVLSLSGRLYGSLHSLDFQDNKVSDDVKISCLSHLFWQIDMIVNRGGQSGP